MTEQDKDFAEILANRQYNENAYWHFIMRNYINADLLRIAAELEDLNYASATATEIAMRETANFILRERGI